MNADWNYIYAERLGILCGDEVPTPAQKEMAKKDADEYTFDRKLKERMEHIGELARSNRRQYAIKKNGLIESYKTHPD